MPTIILRKQTLVLAAAIGLGGLYSEQAHAECIRFNNAITAIGAEGMEITVPPGARAGDRLASLDGVGGGTGVMLNCRGGASSARNAVYVASAPTAWPGVVTTNLPGIGIKLTYKDNSGLEMGDTTEREFPHTSSHYYGGSGNVEVRYDGHIRAEFFLIDDSFSGGSLPASGTFATRYADNALQSYHSINYRAIKFIRAGCAIDVADLNQAVLLNNVDVNVFDGPGSGSAWKSISLRSEQCDLSRFNTVQMTASAGNASIEDPTLFATTGVGRGVGVELGVTSTGAKIEPGGIVSFPTVAAGGQYTLRARYTRTVAPLVLGAADSTITINVEYL